MRNVTLQACKSFKNCKNFSLSNTVVKTDENGVTNLYLHGNLIAMYTPEEKELVIRNAGWYSNTTKERLNGVLKSFNLGGIFQKNWSRYFMDNFGKISEFNGFMEFSL